MSTIDVMERYPMGYSVYVAILHSRFFLENLIRWLVFILGEFNLMLNNIHYFLIVHVP